MIRAIGFDLDNTLFDHTQAAGEGIASMAKSNGWNVEPSINITREWNKIERFYFDQYLEGIFTLEEHRRERMQAFLTMANISASSSNLDDMWTEYLLHYSRSWVAYSDVHSTLAELQERDIKLAVLTNGQQAQQESKLAKLEIANYFEFLLAIGTMRKPKPHPESFLQLADLLGCSPDEVLYVGDDIEVDYHAAQRAGLKSVWLNRGEIHTPPSVEHQIYTLTTVLEFLK